MNTLLYCFSILVVVACAENPAGKGQIIVKDTKGTIFTSYSAQKFSEQKSLICSLEGADSAKWSISPETEGISMRESGILTIDASEIRPKQTYTITATTKEGNTTLPFDIEIYGCEYGDFLVIYPCFGFNQRMELYSGDTLLFNNTLRKALNLCVPVATYRYVIFYNLTGRKYVTMNDDHGARYHMANLYRIGTYEGTFSNDPKVKLSVSFPQVVYVSRQIKRIHLLWQGRIDRVVIEPEVEFDSEFFDLTLFPVVEPTTYTITAFHGDESVTTTFTVYRDTCPEGYSLIDVMKVGSCKESMFTLPDLEPDTYFEEKMSFCIQENSFNATLLTSDSCALQFLKDGFVFFQHAPTHTSITVTVRRLEPVTFASQLAFSTDAPKSKWATVKFDDSAWKRGKEGGWGAFTSSAAWFRAPFTMEKGFSFSRVFVRGEGSARIFVNGNAFSRATLTETGVAIVIPPAYLAERNVIAVEVAKGASSTIHFGLSVMLTNTPLTQMMDGEASSIQPNPDPSHPAQDAFFSGNDYDHFWVTDAVPAELIFTFRNDTQHVVNMIQIACKTAPSFAFDVVGVNGEERVTLASFNRDSTTYSPLTFPNLRAFASYHFVFTAANLTQPIKIFSVFLYTRPLFACPKKYGFKGVTDGTTLYKRCPLGYTGRKAVSCVHENDETFWTESREQCYPTNPVKDYEFMDWTFTIRGITREAWKEGRPMTEMLAEETPMAGRDISYLYEDYAVDGEATVLTVHSRCLLDRGLSAVVKRKLKKLEPRFSELVSKWMGVECTASIGKVVIRHHVNWALVISVSVVSVVVITLVAVYLSFRYKKGVVKHLRKGINPNGDDKVFLLV